MQARYIQDIPKKKAQPFKLTVGEFTPGKLYNGISVEFYKQCGYAPDAGFIDDTGRLVVKKIWCFDWSRPAERMIPYV